MSQTTIPQNEPAFPKHIIETAYCFFHQKQRVYEYSTMDWQKDDIECAISSYVDTMDAALYAYLAGDSTDYLLSHSRFGDDLRHAVGQLEEMLFS